MARRRYGELWTRLEDLRRHAGEFEHPGDAEWIEGCFGIQCRWVDAVRRRPELRRRFLRAAGLHRTRKVERLVSELVTGVEQACAEVLERARGSRSQRKARLKLVERIKREVSDLVNQLDTAGGGEPCEPRRPVPRTLRLLRRSCKRGLTKLEKLCGTADGKQCSLSSAASARKAHMNMTSLLVLSPDGERWKAANQLLAVSHTYFQDADASFGADIDDWPRVAEWVREQDRQLGFGFLLGAEYPDKYVVAQMELLTEWLTRPSVAAERDRGTLYAAPGFRTVVWRGHEWNFALQAAKVVEALSSRLENRLPMTLAEIAEAAESEATPFRLKVVFRGRGKSAHDTTPTIGQEGTDALIVRVDRGKYSLNPAIRAVQTFFADVHPQAE